MSDIQLCPVCGSGKVLAAKGLGDSVKCTSCEWSGQASDTVSRPMGLGQAESIAEAVASTYLQVLAIYAGSLIGRAMVDSGLVTINDRASLTRLIKAATLGAHKATLEEIEKIQKEIKDGNAG